jgi:hypothetical protein
MGKPPHLPDWGPTRDPKRNAEIEREVNEELRKEEEARKAHLAKLKAMEPTLLDRRQRCSGALGVLQTEVRMRKNNWWNVVVDLTEVYEAAWTNFTKAFTLADKQNEKMWIVAFVALSAISAGGIAVFVKWAGGKWIRNEAKELIISGLKDSIITGVAGLFTLAPEELAVDYGPEDIPSPQTYKGKLEKLLNNMENDLLDWIKKKQTLINNMPLAKFEFYEPSELERQIQEFMAGKEKKFNPQPFKDSSVKRVMQIELEKVMWVTWFARAINPQLGAAISSHWYGSIGRLPDTFIDKLLELKLIDGGGRYGDDIVLKLASPADGSLPQRIMAKAKLRAENFKPPKTFGLGE